VINTTTGKSFTHILPTPTPVILPIRSRQQLEKALLKVLKVQTAKLNAGHLSIEKLSSEFHKEHGESLKHFLETLNIKNKSLVFLKSCQAFELKLVGKKWQISAKQ
jgi:hypothetical protein